MRKTSRLLGTLCSASLLLSACGHSSPVVTSSGSVPEAEAPENAGLIVANPVPDEATSETPADEGKEALVASTKVPALHKLDKVRLGPGDHGDALTTGYGLWSGVATEANPMLAPFGQALPLLVLPVKYGLKKLLVVAGVAPARANVTIESAGAIGTCSNIAILSGGAVAPALGLGLFCALAYNETLKRGYEKDTGHTLDGTPVPLKQPKPAPEPEAEPAEDGEISLT